MPPSLRKSCHGCTAAKRRCVPQLPQCPRCRNKGLTCNYDLEPVTNTSSHDGQLSMVDGKQSHSLSILRHSCVFSSVASAHHYATSNYRPQGSNVEDMLLIADPETFNIILKHLNRIPSLTFQNKTSPFVHAQILSTAKTKSAICAHAQSQSAHTVSTISSEQLYAEQQRLLALDANTLQYTEFLCEFHTIIALILASALPPRPETNVSGLSRFEALVGLFRRWGEHFNTILPEDLSSHLSPWQAWIIAESSRRTIFAIWWISGLLELLQTGYCSFRPFVEALPFDARTGLWEADTEEEWKAALDDHGGLESSLMSWCEFIESGGASPRPGFDGLFQRLLLAGHFGKYTQMPHNARPAVSLGRMR